MRFISRSVFAALVAVFVMSAVGAASASAALPNFNTGLASGNVKFTGTGTNVYLIGGFGEYKCNKASVTGEVEHGEPRGNSKTLKNVVIKFSQCGSLELLCEREWKTKPLTGTLGYLSKEFKKVGVLLKPSSGPVAECKGFGSNGNIIGSLVMEISPSNKSVTEYSLASSDSGGVQSPQKLEGETENHRLEWLREGAKEAQPLVVAMHLNLTLESKVEIEA
jgi:hypothetical protein